MAEPPTGEATTLLPRREAAPTLAGFICVRALRRLAADVRWADDEVHTMLTPPDSGKEVWPVTAYCCAPLSCPLHWVLRVALTLSLVLGLWTHRIVANQGGPVRPDETPEERTARVSCILLTDGPFAAAAVVALIRLVVVLATHRTHVLRVRHSSAYARTIRATGLSLAVDTLYVAGNVVFLDAMRREDVLLVRVAIASNAAFGTGLLALLAFGFARAVQHHRLSDVSTRRLVAWLARCFVCALFVAAVGVYVRLWHAYDDRATARNVARDGTFRKKRRRVGVARGRRRRRDSGDEASTRGGCCSRLVLCDESSSDSSSSRASSSYASSSDEDVLLPRQRPPRAAVVDADDDDDDEESLWDDVSHLLVVSVAAIIVWTLFVVAAFVVDRPHALWAAIVE